MSLPRPIFAVRCFCRRVTPLTWLIWMLLLSDLSAPGHLRFHLVLTEVDMKAFVVEALDYATGD